jgi:hypothetical protein
MGKDYVPMRQNGASFEQIRSAFAKLKKRSVVEASSEDFFRKKLPDASFISEIELGDKFTKESIVRFKDGGFVVFKGSLDIPIVFPR